MNVLIEIIKWVAVGIGGVILCYIIVRIMSFAFFKSFKQVFEMGVKNGQEVRERAPRRKVA